VPDRQPPRSGGDELEVLMTALQFQRESFLRKVEDVTDEQARTSAVPSGTSLLWLTRHVAFAEQIWIVERFAGETRTAVNEVAPDDTIVEAIDAYRRTWAQVDGLVRARSLEDAIDDPSYPGQPLSLRWIVVHLLEEVARHAGHADILRELLDGETGR
jgi:hypothetical protein